MKELHCMDNTLVRVDTMEHFVYKDEKGRSVRRRGVGYYVLFTPSPPGEGSAAGYLAPYVITNKTDGSWLQDAIAAGQVYLHKMDYEKTLPKKREEVAESSARKISEDATTA